MKASDLQLNAHEIPSAGISLVGELPAEWVVPSLLPAYRASSPLALELEVTPVGDNFLARGKLRLRLEFECSRTLQPSAIDIEEELAELFTPGDQRALNLADDEVSSDDLAADEPWIIDGGHIDLEALVREHLVLAQDPYPVAPDAPDAGSTPLWSSRLVAAPGAIGSNESQPIDARWERLKNLKLD